MSMLSLRRSQKQSGFTLMELLIVIAVLGLLLGMLIPRLAGITDDTVDTVCDTNNKGIRYYTQAFYNKNNAMPNGLTNLVDYSNDGTTNTYQYLTDADGTGGTDSPAYLPSFQDDNDADGEAEVIAEEFYLRNHPNAYQLNEDEVAELKSMGITTVYNYFGSTSTTISDRSMQKVTIAEDDYVMMMGLTGADGSTAWGVDASDGTSDLSASSSIGNPLWLGRIFMAVNDQCDLVKQGYIQASALCPGAVLNEDSFTHKEYILVLPRLAATVERAETDGVINEDTAIAFKDASTTGDRVIEDTFSAQAAWEFDMSCPEGHKWPDNDEDSWVEATSTEVANYTSIFGSGS